MNNNVSISSILYNGLSDPKAFVQRFKLQARFQAWDATVQLEALPDFLTDKAKTAYDAITDKTNITATLASLVTALSKSSSTLFEEFTSRKLRPDETVSAFALSLQDLLIKACPNLNEAARLPMLQGILCASLDSSTRALVKFSSTLTWSQLIKALDEALPNGPDSPPLIKQEPSAEVNWADAQRSDGAGHNNRNDMFVKRFNGYCSYCNIQGHKAAECHRRIRDQGQFQPSHQQRQHQRFQPQQQRQHQHQHQRFQPQQQLQRQQTPFQPQQGTMMYQPKQSNQTSTNVIDAQDQCEEFPFFVDNNSIETSCFESSFGAPVKLLKVKTSLRLFGQPEQDVLALFDSGSTHSFISPSVLSKAQVAIANDRDQCSRHNFVIQGATGDAKSSCCVTTASIRIGAWHGEHDFVISGAVVKHEMILGRNFFKRFNVSIDHSIDSISIGDSCISVNTTDASVQSAAPASRATSNAIIDSNQRRIFNELSGIRSTLAKLVSSTPSSGAQAPVEPPCKDKETVAECKSIEIRCVVAADTLVKPHSQRLVPFAISDGSTMSHPVSMFEPIRSLPANVLVARSLHVPSSMLYCNVINPTDVPVTMRARQELGYLSEVEEANAKFDDDVISFVPLDVNALKQEASSHLPEQRNDFERVSSLRINDKLEVSQRDQLRTLFCRHVNAFQWSSTETGRTKLVEHSVPTGEHPPIQQRQYSIPSIAREPLAKQVDDMLASGIIRHSSSSWRSPVLLAKKKLADGSSAYRFCIDFKKVNNITTKDSYSLPLIHRTVDALSGAKFFTKLDLDRAFWQIGVAEEDKKKLAFVVDGKLYEFNVMPFGGTNAPATFQRLVDRVLHGLTWRQCLVYIDDVLIFSSTFEEHLKHLHEVFSRFEFAGLKLKPTKCTFANEEVEYLGFKITREGLAATDAKVKVIASLSPPVTNKQLYSFLCSINYYRTLIPNYGELSFSLYDMARSPKRACQWSKESLEKFEALKRALITAPILVYPDFSKQFRVHSDASDWAIAAVLLQQHAELLKPVAFASRRLTSTEHHYTVSELFVSLFIRPFSSINMLNLVSFWYNFTKFSW